MKSKSTAVLLMTMGDPESVPGIFPFLVRLFSDPLIIRAPWFVRGPLSLYIGLKKFLSIAGRYRQIGGGSPMNGTTLRQAELLEARLNESAPGAYRVFVANRYNAPSTKDAYRRIRSEGIRKIIALPLYPHFSSAITGSSFGELKKLVNKDADAPEVVWVRSICADAAFAAAFGRKIREGLEEFPEEARGNVQMLFSAHSLPHDFIKAGDPYLDEIRAGLTPLLKMLKPAYFHLCFQSKGRKDIEWLQPETEKVMEELAAKDRKDMLLVPISFVAENIETLYDGDILYRKHAKSLGARFMRVKCLGTDADFIDALAGVVARS